MKKETKKAPTIRFRGFTDDWEQRKLEDVLTIHTEKNGDRYSREDVLAISDTYGCVNQIEFHGRSFAGDNISNYKVVHKGDIIYTKSPLRAKPYGIIKIFEGENGIISPLYIVNQVLDGIDSKFIYYMFDTPEKTNNYLRPLVRKGAKNTMNISNDEWLSGKITITPIYDEQHKIGQYFNNLDYLITLHQRKLDQLKTLKKYFLQNMFPAKGEKVPRIRFKGFTGDWEQHKLGELLEFHNGFNGSTDMYGGEIPLISVMDILNNNFITHDNIRTHVNVNENEKKRFSVTYGDVLFQRSSENFEDAGTSNVYLDKQFDAMFGGFVICGKKCGDYNPVYFKYMLDSTSIRNQIIRKAQGAQHVNVSQVTLQNVFIRLPELDEQETIGQFFLSFENNITLHQRKLTQLQTMKKFMLQNLFI
jgi:type I restriction enzyme S subunit